MQNIQGVAKMEYTISTDKIKHTISDTWDGAVNEFDSLIAKTASVVGIKINDDGCGEKEAKALVIVRRYSTISFFGGLIPVPLADIALITSAQLKMLQEIATVYDIPFSEERIKFISSSVLGSLIPQSLSAGIAGSAVKSIPVVGTVAGMLMMPALSSGVSYALGKTFIQHFEAGGTLLDLNPSELKSYFEDHLSNHLSKKEDDKSASELINNEHVNANEDKSSSTPKSPSDPLQHPKVPQKIKP
jgi:hypothetical protein